MAGDQKKKPQKYKPAAKVNAATERRRKSKKPKKPAPPKTSADFTALEISIRSMVRRSQLGSTEATAELTKQFFRMLWQMAIHACPHDNDKEDFVNICYIYFTECIRTFDFRRGTKFITHCYSRIPRQILRQRADYHNLIHIPACARFDGARAPLLTSIDLKYETSHGESHSTDWLVSEIPDIEGDIDREREISELRRLIDELPAQEQDVIRSRMRGETLEVIGKRMKVAKERVRQIESYAREILRRWMTGQELSQFHNYRIRSQAKAGAAGMVDDELPVSEVG